MFDLYSGVISRSLSTKGVRSSLSSVWKVIEWRVSAEQGSSYTDLEQEGSHSNSDLSHLIDLLLDLPRTDLVVDDVHLEREPPAPDRVLGAVVVVWSPVEVELDGPVAPLQLPSTQHAPLG